MSGPSLRERVYNRDAEDLERRHIQNLRSLADRVEQEGMFREETRENYPNLTGERRRAIVALLRAKADKLEAHMDAIDTLFSDEFRQLLQTVEWCSTGDYGSGKVAKEWDEYHGIKEEE